MCDIKYEELEEIQVTAAYTLFRALKENKNIESIEDFWNFYEDRKNDFRNNQKCGHSSIERQ